MNIAIFAIETKEQQKNRLSVLHGRLQEEAEKIRKWKNSTELELKQKDQQLREAQQMIEKQRKSIIDAQVCWNDVHACITVTQAHRYVQYRAYKYQ